MPTIEVQTEEVGQDELRQEFRVGTQNRKGEESSEEGKEEAGESEDEKEHDEEEEDHEESDTMDPRTLEALQSFVDMGSLVDLSDEGRAAGQAR